MTSKPHLTLLLCITLSLLSCSSKPKLEAQAPPIQNPPSAIAGDVLVSNQGIVQLKRPQGWTDQLAKEDTLNLKMANATQDAYLTLQTRTKKDLPHLSLEKFAKIAREAGLETMTDLEMTGPTEVTVVNGYPAIQYQFRGKVEGLETVLLHTAIESPAYFHQILAGSSAFGFEQHQQTLQKIIQTFQEVPVTASGQ
jgi:hypothetical protein